MRMRREEKKGRVIRIFGSPKSDKRKKQITHSRRSKHGGSPDGPGRDERPRRSRIPHARVGLRPALEQGTHAEVAL